MSTSRLPIFDDVARSDTSPAHHNESTFAFLNRVAGTYWQAPRSLVQRWGNNLASDREYVDLRQRIRSRNDGQFRSALLELFLHECLVRAGYQITVHPELDDTTRRPDFLAERHGQKLYIEAMSPGINPAAQAASSRTAQFFDAIDKVGNRDFLLHLTDLHSGPNPARGSVLRAELRRWLSSLDPVDFPALDDSPEYLWSDKEWSATFKAIPRSAQSRSRGAPDRSIGVFGYGRASFVDDAGMIQRALAVKDSAYGSFSDPYLIALGTYTFDSDHWGSTNAFYGHETFELYQDDHGIHVAEPVRHLDGYFGGPPHWNHRNVSGVLIVNQLMPDHSSIADSTLWFHPSPHHTISEPLDLPVASMRLEGSGVTKSDSPLDLHDFLEVDTPWPPGVPFEHP